MDIILSGSEKKFFDRMQLIRAVLLDDTQPAQNESLDKLIIQTILYNRFLCSGLKPAQGDFDALTDDIHHYMQKSLEDFIVFIKEKSRRTN